MRQYRISVSMLWWLIVAQAIAILPHITRVPIWLYALFIFCAFRRMMVAHGYWSLPKPWFVFSVACIGLISIVISHIDVLSIEAANALLVLAFSLKLLELKSHRDSNLIVFLGFFLVLSNLLHSQGVWMLAYLIVSLSLFTLVFIGLNRQGDVRPLGLVFGRTLALLLQAAPLTLLLLFLFPRPDWPFLNFAQDALKAKTGFTDELTPGLVSEVAESNDVVFRAKFLSHNTPNEAFYWRGWTFDTYDGYRWTREGRSTGAFPSLGNVKGLTHYAIWMQETLYRQLFILGLPAHHVDGFYLTEDYLLQSNRLVPAFSPFVVSSYHQESFPVPITAEEREYFLQLPQELNPKATALATNIKENHALPRDRIEALKSYLTDSELKYHLKVPTLRGESRIDDFLFRTRIGYCEHFATAYAFLARAVDVPARVVAGFLGGEFHEATGEWLVRKRHAHTWVEVWLPESGWLRLDPTEFVAPWRVNEFESYYGDLLKENGTKGWITSQFLSLRTIEPLNGWLSSVESVNQHWMSSMHTDFSGFSHQWKQRLVNFSQLLNYAHYFSLLLLLVLISFILGLVKRRIYKPSASHLDIIYARFLNLLKERGVTQQTIEGPNQFVKRACMALPAHEAEIMDLHQRFMMVKFGAPMDKSVEKEIVKGLKAKLKLFKKALSS